MAVASHLVRPTRSSNAPGRVSLLIWPCSDRGLPCRACCQTRGGLLPHRFTLTLWDTRPVCSLWPCPSPHGAQALPGGLTCGARTFLEWPLLPATRDHRPHHFQAGKLPATGASGQVLLREAPDHATQTVGRGTVEPKPRVLGECGESQTRQFGRRECRAHGLEADGGEREHIARSIAACHRRPRVLTQPEENRRVRAREPAQQAEREPVGGRIAGVKRKSDDRTQAPQLT